MNTVNNPESTKEQFSIHKCCVIIPTYNNAQTLEKLIEGVRKITDNIIIVNDGSTDNTGEILLRIKSPTIIQFESNRGKGAAIKEGFRKALDLGFKYAITIDSDGQHNPEDIPELIHKSKTNPNSIIIGSRNMALQEVPGKSSFGNKFSNFWFCVETGKKLPDTQSGFRLYPIFLMKDIHFFTNRFEFEVEVLVKSFWNRIDVQSVPVSVYYPPKSERVTHFRPFWDFLRISVLNSYLVILSLFYYSIIRFFRKFTKDNIKSFFQKHLFDKNESNLKKALSVAFGVFMGVLPIWGYQLVVAIPLAFLLKLNKLIVVIAANISIPPMIPFILFGSYLTGAIVLGNDIGAVFKSEITFEFLKNNLIQYIVGSCVFAVFLGSLLGLSTYIILEIFSKRKQKEELDY